MPPELFLDHRNPQIRPPPLQTAPQEPGSDQAADAKRRFRSSQLHNRGETVRTPWGKHRNMEKTTEHRRFTLL